MKYDDLRNSDEFPETPAVVLLLDSIIANIAVISDTSVIHAMRDVDTLSGVVSVLKDIHYRLCNINVSPF